MTQKKSRKPSMPKPAEFQPSFKPEKRMPVTIDPDDSHAITARKLAAQLLSPEASASRVIRAGEDRGGLGDILDSVGMQSEIRAIGRAVNAGDLSSAEAMLVGQALSMQMLSARLIERGLAQEYMPQFETFLRLGMKAQAQSRQAIEALGNLKHGPAIYARQANVAQGGPMQVNNNPAPPAMPAQARVEDMQTSPSQLSLAHELHANPSPSSCSSGTDAQVASLGEVHRAKDS